MKGDGSAAIKAWQTRWAKKNSFNKPPTTQELKKAKYTARAKKAWESRRRKHNPQLKDYDCVKKNAFRDRVINSFKDIDQPCLALESDKFIFVNSLPNTKFVIVERSKEQFSRMISNLPKNVEIILNADISVVKRIRLQITENQYGAHYIVEYGSAFLDFCQTYDVMKSTIETLSPMLRGMKKVAFTFSLRKNKKQMEDYKFDLIKKLQEILPEYKLEYAEAYRDGAPMIGIILINGNIENTHMRHLTDYEVEKNCILDWANKYCKTHWGHNLHEWGDPILNPRAYTENKIKDHEKVLELWNALPQEYKNYIRHWRIQWSYAFGNLKLRQGPSPSTYDTDLWRFVEVLA